MRTESKQVVGYVRVSVDAPDKVSPEMQADAIEQYCQMKSWDLVDTIVERGRSAGEGKKRPGFDRARKLISTRQASGLIVWKLDRASRSVVDFANLMAELRKADAEFVSITESFDTSTSTGRFTLNVMMALAEMERDRMSERTASWAAYRAKQGKPPMSSPILGYERVNKQFIVDESAGPAVKGAIELFLESGSVSAAQRHLLDAGYVKYWNTTRDLLQSPTLAGYRVVDGVLIEGEWPAIIDLETHQAVVDMFNRPTSRRNRRGRPTTSARWLLTSIAFCGADGCGLPMGAGPATPVPMYRCSRVRKQFLPGVRCGLTVSRDILDRHVEEWVLDRITPDAWHRMRTGRQELKVRPMVDTVALDAELDQMAKDWGAGLLTRSEFYAAKDTLLARIAEAEEEMDASLDDVETELPDVTDLHKAWKADKLSIEAKRLVIAAVVDRVVVGRGRYGPKPGGIDRTAERFQIIPRSGW